MDLLVHQVSKHNRIVNLHNITLPDTPHENYLVVQSSGVILILSSSSTDNKALQLTSTHAHLRPIVLSSSIFFDGHPCIVVLDVTKRLYLFTTQNNTIHSTELSSVQISIFLEYHSMLEINLQTINNIIVLYSKESCQIYLIDLLLERQVPLTLKNFNKIEELIVYKEFDYVCLSILATKPSLKTLNESKKEITRLEYILNDKTFTLKKQNSINKDQIYQILKISNKYNKGINTINTEEDELTQYKVTHSKDNNNNNEIVILSFTNLYINTRITLQITDFVKNDYIFKNVIYLFNSSFIMLLISNSNSIYILNSKTNELKLLAKFNKIKSLIELENNKIGIYIKRKGLFIFEITTDCFDLNKSTINKNENENKEINTFRQLKESILKKNNNKTFQYNFNLIKLLDVQEALNTQNTIDTNSFYTSNDIYCQSGNDLYYKGTITLKEKDKEIQNEIKSLVKKFPFINTSYKHAFKVINNLRINNLFSVTLNKSLTLKVYKNGKIIIEKNGNLVFRNVFDLPLSEKNIQTEEIESGDEIEESLSDSMEDLNDFNINSVGVLFDNKDNIFIFISSKFKLLIYSLHLIKRKFSLKYSIESEFNEIKQLENDNLGFFVRNKLLLFFSVKENKILINCSTDNLKKNINELLNLQIKAEETYQITETSYKAKGVEIITSGTNNNFRNLTFKLKQNEKIVLVQNIKNKIMLIDYFNKRNTRENTLLFSLNYKNHYSFVKIKISEGLLVCSDLLQLFKCNSANFFFDNPNLENYQELKKTNYLVFSTTALNEENGPSTKPTKSTLIVLNLPIMLEFIKPYLINKEKEKVREIELGALKEIPLDIIKSETLEFNFPIENITSYDGFFIVSVNSILYLIGLDKTGKVNIKSMIDLMNKIVKVVKVQNLLIVYLQSNVIEFVVFENKCFQAVVLDRIKIGSAKNIDLVLCNVGKEVYGLFVVDELKGTFILLNDLDNINPKIMKTIYWNDKKATKVYSINNKKCIGGIVGFDNGSEELILYDVEI